MIKGKHIFYKRIYRLATFPDINPICGMCWKNPSRLQWCPILSAKGLYRCRFSFQSSRASPDSKEKPRSTDYTLNR